MSQNKLSFKAAAKELLKRAGEPMTAKELTAQAIDEGLIAPEGKTPEATMAAQLYVDINKNPKTVFRKAGRGKFSLRQQTESASSPQVIIENQNELVRGALKKQLHEMDAYQFEFLIADLLQKLGYENVQVTRYSGDRGIDIMADLTLEGITDVKTVVQVKRFKEGHNVPGSVVTQLRGSAEVDQRGLIITTSRFTKDAIAEAKAANKMPVALINGDWLVALLMKNGVGVNVEAVALYSIDKQYFTNIEPGNGPIDQGNKSRGLWPLPGGTTAYVDTLLKVLGAVEQGVNTRGKLIDWFLRTFDTVKSAKSAAGYVNVPRAMGLITGKDGKLTLTPSGEKVLETGDIAFLYETFAENVFAIEEILKYLEASAEPQTEEDVFEFLRENLDVEWTTFAQVNFRLLWLMNLGKAKKTEEGWVPA